MYHNVQRACSMNFISNLYWSTTAFCHCYDAFLRGFEIPDDILELRMLDYLSGCEW